MNVPFELPFTITVNEVNQPPSVSEPVTAMVNENAAITFATMAGNAITVADVDSDGNSEQLTLTATGGTFMLSTSNGLVVVSGSNGSSALVVTGTLATLNAALNGLVFTPTANTYGTASLSVSVNDLGNTGLGGPMTASATVAIAVKQMQTSHLVFKIPPHNLTAGQVFCPPITVDIVDQTGKLLKTNDSTVTISIFSGPAGAVLHGTLSVKACDGVATFYWVSLTTAGTYTLAVADPGMTGAVSKKFTVKAAEPYKLVFGQQPTNVIAGNAISPAVTVLVEDRYGNIVTQDDSRVTITLEGGCNNRDGGDNDGRDDDGDDDDGGNCNQGQSQTVRVKDGVATFSEFKPTTAGTYTLRATDDCLAPAESNCFTVSAGAPAQLAFTQTPCNPRHGVPFTIQVSVEDRYGNICTADSTAITLSLSKGPRNALLKGILTQIAINGVATFGGLTVSASGEYSLLATSSDPTLKGTLCDFGVG